MALFAFVQRGTAQRHTLVNRAAVANFSRFANDHAHGVIKKYAGADFCSGVNLDTRQTPRNVRNKPAQPLQAVVPAPMRPAMQHQRMQAGVARQHLPGGAGCGVTVKDAGNI